MPKDDEKNTGEPNLGFSELMNLSLAFNSRVDALWQRVLYAHAAIVGVMAFFASAEDIFAVPRLLVFFFYTLNIGLTIAAFRESYSGLDATLADLKAYPRSRKSLNIQTWVLERSYHRHARRRVLALAFVWLVLGYLLVYPVIVDLFPD